MSCQHYWRHLTGNFDFCDKCLALKKYEFDECGDVVTRIVGVLINHPDKVRSGNA
ncbi:MAG: hypothetical protein KAS32_19890 [Candidatus Peribacteraceae bacterium]|nr:hypothetical protein [Candidatus Peribacteraceae bacterium]